MEHKELIDEQKLNKLLKKYRKGDKSVYPKMAEMLTDYSFKILSEKYSFDRNAIKLMVEDRLSIELTKDASHNADYFIRYVHLRVYENLVQWGAIPAKRTSHHIVKVSVSNGEEMFDNVSERLDLMKRTRVTETQWKYNKILTKFKETNNEQQLLEGVFELTHKKLLKYVKNYDYALSLRKEEIEDCVKDTIIKIVQKRTKEHTIPESYYMWMVALKHSIRTHLDNLVKSKEQDEIEPELEIISLYDLIEEPSRDADPLENTIKQENIKDFYKFLKETLTDRQFELIILKFKHNLTYMELAKEMNLSYNRIREIEKVALARLRIAIKNSDKKFTID